jgi:hypothetical protein
MGGFQHPPLQDASKQIRLLHFHPKSTEVDITCTLTTHDLDTAPSCATISYVWGTPDSERHITISGGKFEVTSDCYYALSQVFHACRDLARGSLEK